ncbi:MAG: Omp28 family outer membrane lipoprotein [Bacteroidia bacterium]|nr:Omp28 family outer membrane lipoprotein [Bacteroidia bacterium]NNC86425.1 Omp28 family outer membrane lipoprotein [Bacteroidia bacterium]NNM16245.1 Omp28 family outer membrane lipoprotein [Bacteroidia bacterium]
MNKWIITLIIGAFIMQSCDQIDGNFGDGNGTTPPDTGLVRKVLIEDYTGHTCGNCPRAALALDPLKALYGDDLIILSVHAGFFALPQLPDYPADFQTQVGDDIDQFFGVSAAGNPNGMVNRKEVNGNPILAYTSWGSEIANNITLAPDAKIEMTSTYDSGTREIDLSVITEFVNSASGTYKMSAYLVEDNVISDQKNYDVTPEHVINYNHRHMLRGSFNGSWGDAVNSTVNTPQQFDYNLTLSTDFDENNISIISFIYEDGSKEIIQVEEHHITP